MRNARTTSLRSVPSGRLAPALLAAAVGLAPLSGCVTTHTIAPDQLPSALESVQGKDQRRVVKGEDGKPVELPSPAHLRWVQVETRSAGDAQKFDAPVSAKLAADGLHVEGKDGARTYPLSAIRSLRVRHDDHKADTVGGVVLLSIGVTALVAATAVVIYDFGVYQPSCTEDCWPGFASLLFAAPAGVVGLGFGIPGVILTTRGVSGRGQPPKDLVARPTIPQLSVGPGSAVVTVPF